MVEPQVSRAGCFGHSLGFRSLAWVRDPDVAWVDCEVVEANGEDIKDLVLNKYADVDDSSTLTYTGNIILTVKPFRKLPHLYDSHMMTQYKGAAFGELSPLPFSVADAAYSGESGAVTTESTKLLMWYLAYIVEQQVPESNPVLEASGKAKTVRNNNSRGGNFAVTILGGRLICVGLILHSLEESEIDRDVTEASDLNIFKNAFAQYFRAPMVVSETQKDLFSIVFVAKSRCMDPDVAWVDCEVVDANGEDIKTYTGNIILAVKPFRKLPHLYYSHMMTQYKGAAFGELNPLPFAVADAAYRYVVAIMNSKHPSNPVLEAFGNANKVRNNNS
ncbi:unnamed protein product, partial [Ilex paraguariensis]